MDRILLSKRLRLFGVLVVFLIAQDSNAQILDFCRGLLHRFRGVTELVRTKAHPQPVQDPASLVTGFYQSESDLAPTLAQAGEEMSQLNTIIQASRSQDSQLQPLKDWVKSPAHLRVLYQHLEEFSPAIRDRVYQIIVDSKAEKGIHPIRGPPRSLVTFAFEKESNNPALSLMYRDPQVSDEIWTNESLESNQRRLFHLIGLRRKQFVPETVVAPTALKPEYLGGISLEWNGVFEKQVHWEVAHKSYEIDSKYLFAQVRDLAQLLNETHSFHLHLVFDLSDRSLQLFNIWHKRLNDYLYFVGLEEGLHANALTGVPDFADLPTRLDKVKARSNKFYAAGLRGKIYGPSKSNDFYRVGVELRDVTRNLNRLEKIFHKAAADLEAQVWERYSDEILATALKKSFIQSSSDLKVGVAEEWHAYFKKQEPLYAIPFQSYSKMFDLTPEKQNQINEALKKYQQDLDDLVVEIKTLRSKKEDVIETDVRDVLRMSMATWAKKAQISELFSEYR